MAKAIEFAKFSGSGNDFICIDNRDGRHDAMIEAPERIGHFARALCRRGLGIGADGVIFACDHEVGDLADISARFFESDGSETELCGNGVGCFVHWVRTSGWVPEAETRILTPAGVVRGTDSDGRYVRVCIPLPEDQQQNLTVETDGKTWECDLAVTGVPHLVTYVDDVDAVDVPRWGAALRHHERFQPRGVNANFVQVLEPGRLAVRTFEYGVEGETLACGTGSAASAILAARRFGWGAPYTSGDEPIRIRARSGDVLRVYVELDPAGEVVDLCLETVIRSVCTGSIHPDLAAEALAGEPEA